VESIKEHLDAGGLAIGVGQARFLLDEIDRLRKSREHHRQTALDISEDNDQLQKQIEEQNLRMQDLSQKAERLEKLIPPETERGPGFVGQGTWSVFAEKVVEERDELRDELSSLCEEIRVLKEENDELREELEQLGDMVSAKKEHSSIQELLRENSELHRVNSGLQEEVTRCGTALSSKNEHANINYGHDGFIGIEGYGPFSLKRVDKDYWEVRLLNERVALYNKKGRRVRGQVIDGNHEGDW
jgi:DNA repair exonuclease SbcCD ATPase subunit